MTALEPADRQLLDFLCAVECNRHCVVRSVKTRLRPSLRRLRYAGLVWFDSYKPSASAIADWQARQSPPTPGGAAGEEPPRPKAADEEGGAVARLPSAPPITEYPAASGTARKASSASSSGDATRVRDGAAPAEPQPPSTEAPAGAHPRDTRGTSSGGQACIPECTGGRLVQVGPIPERKPRTPDTAASTYRCGHPRTEENSHRVGKMRGPVCARCRNERARAAREAKPKPKPDREPRAKSAHELDGLRRSARARRETTQRAKERIEQGLDPKNAKQASVRHAQYALAEQMALSAKLADPVEQAKAALRKKYTPVVSMAVYGGAEDRFMVGSRKDLTQDELLAMAERLAA